MTPKYEPELGAKYLGLAMVAMAELMRGMSVTTPTGMTAVAGSEIAHHLEGFGRWVAFGNSTKVEIHDRADALGQTVAMSALVHAGMTLFNTKAVFDQADDGHPAHKSLAILMRAIDGGQVAPDVIPGSYLSKDLDSRILPID